jgi:hypothetical protein
MNPQPERLAVFSDGAYYPTLVLSLVPPIADQKEPLMR